MTYATHDKFANWQEVKCDRQAYATSAVYSFQRSLGIKTFAQLVQVFRAAGETFDIWEGDRGEAA